MEEVFDGHSLELCVGDIVAFDPVNEIIIGEIIEISYHHRWPTVCVRPLIPYSCVPGLPGRNVIAHANQVFKIGTRCTH